MSVEYYEGDRIEITLNNPKKQTCTINLFGSTVTNWSIDNRELLFNSKNSKLDGNSEYFGGIPLVFPQFALAKPPNPAHQLPIHGFVRMLKFTYDSELTQINQAEDTIQLTLSINATQFQVQKPDLYKLWPFRFNYAVQFTIKDRELGFQVKLQNLEDKELWATPLFHNYLRVDDIQSVQLRGFQNVQYIDKLKNQEVTFKNDQASITLNSGIDNIYIDGLKSGQQLSLELDQHSKIELFNSNLKDCVVWNPWTQGVNYGLCEDDYRHFLCVELGHVTDPYKVQPNQVYEYGQILKFSQQ